MLSISIWITILRHTSLWHGPIFTLLTQIYRLISSGARCIGAGESAPEQVEEEAFTARRIERLPRNVAAAITADLPTSPRLYDMGRYLEQHIVIRQPIKIALVDRSIIYSFCACLFVGLNYLGD